MASPDRLTDQERGARLGHKWLEPLKNNSNTYECANGCGSRVTIDFYNDTPESAAIYQNIGKCQPPKSKKRKK